MNFSNLRFQVITIHIAEWSMGLLAKDGHPDKRERAFQCTPAIFAGMFIYACELKSI